MTNIITMKYEEAIHKLETMANDMEDGEMSIDRLADSITEAKELIKFCRDQLTQVDDKIEKILSGQQ